MYSLLTTLAFTLFCTGVGVCTGTGAGTGADVSTIGTGTGTGADVSTGTGADVSTVWVPCTLPVAGAPPCAPGATEAPLGTSLKFARYTSVEIQ